MLAPYSAAYYLDRVSVEPADGDHAVLEREQHRQAVAAVYTAGVGVERLDLPLVVKLGHQHLPVFADDAVPTGTMAVPEAVLEALPIDEPPAVTEVLVAKAARARQLLEWFSPYTVGRPAPA
jgi:hypothetical protein